MIEAVGCYHQLENKSNSIMYANTNLSANLSAMRNKMLGKKS
jgi:hypothetical protein